MRVSYLPMISVQSVLASLKLEWILMGYPIGMEAKCQRSLRICWEGKNIFFSVREKYYILKPDPNAMGTLESVEVLVVSIFYAKNICLAD